MNDFMFDEGVSPKIGIEEGTIVTCLILEQTFTNAYLKSIEEENKVLKEKAELLDTNYTPLTPSVKEGGLAYKVAVIKKENDSVIIDGKGVEEYVFKYGDDGKLVEPEFPCYFQINIPSLPAIANGKYDLFKKGSVREFDKQGQPVIIDILPSCQPAKIWVDDKGKYVGIADPESAELNAFQKAKLAADEELRVSRWEGYIKKWASISEEDAAHQLRMLMSRKYILASRNPTDLRNPHWVLPAPGVVFTARVKAGKFLDVEKFSYDKTVRKYVVHGDLNAHLLEDNAYTKEIIACRDEAKSKREAYKASLLVEEPPF